MAATKSDLADAKATLGAAITTLQSGLDKTNDDLTATKTGLADANTTLGTAITTLQTLQSDVAASKQVTDAVGPLASYLTFDDQHNIYLTGANLNIRSGSGKTDGTINGLGNLIVGYNENDYSTPKTGSHNLIIGSYNSYSSYGGLVAGHRNTISGIYSSVSGGVLGTASGYYSSVSGGLGGTASGYLSSVSGGKSGTASGDASSVSGGAYGTASGMYSSVSGGAGGKATGLGSSVSGGNAGQANGLASSVVGGNEAIAEPEYSVAP